MRNRHSLRTLLVMSIFFIMLLSSMLTGSSYIVLLMFGIVPFPFLTQLTRPLLLLPFSVLIGMFISVFISARILRPIDDQISATRSVSKGDFSVRVEVGTSVDEIDELQRSFNEMAAELGSIELFREDFINNFSHEFKTPIVSIRGFARQLQREDITEEQRREYAGIIAEESDRLANLASSILLLSKLENQNIVTDKAPFRVDEEIRGILERMSMRLLEADHTGYGDSCFAETERLSGELRQEIDAFLQNQTWQDDIYFMRYVEMRREQCRVLQVIYRQLLRLNQVPEQAKPLSAFLADIAMHFHEGNDCSALLEQLESLYAAYRQDELPDTRESFENRAILYSILTELQSFLQIKRQFYLTLPEQERKQMFERLMQA